MQQQHCPSYRVARLPARIAFWHPFPRFDMAKKDSPPRTALESNAASEDIALLLRELVAHLRQNRTQLREEWARRITRAQLLTAMTEEEIFAEATSVYDNYVEALETG